ncbi:MAG TPA: type II secretion system protein [Verrucomicrobiae bacterium]|nr:type II secretion system protein [Verrucomicrobiae bacterium]
MKTFLKDKPAARHLAFTLVELLTVIAIIAVLASLGIVVAGRVKRTAYINKTQAEMAQVESAIENYKTDYGFYPPVNTNCPNYPFVNPLYYELAGTTNNTLANTFVTLDGSSTISTNLVISTFGIGGFINCNKVGQSMEDSRMAKNYISGLNPNQFGTNSAGIELLVGSVGGPDPAYTPLAGSTSNPWRYRYPGINNPNSYDLWIQLVINGQTNLICNWNSQVQINNGSAP